MEQFFSSFLFISEVDWVESNRISRLSRIESNQPNPASPSSIDGPTINPSTTSFYFTSSTRTTRVHNNNISKIVLLASIGQDEHCHGLIQKDKTWWSEKSSCCEKWTKDENQLTPDSSQGPEIWRSFWSSSRPIAWSTSKRERTPRKVVSHEMVTTTGSKIGTSKVSPSSSLSSQPLMVQKFSHRSRIPGYSLHANEKQIQKFHPKCNLEHLLSALGKRSIANERWIAGLLPRTGTSFLIRRLSRE